MDNVITIISVAASILSIIGFILSIKCKDSIINKICYILIIILTVAASYLYTQYKHVTDEQLSIERRKQEIKHEAIYEPATEEIINDNYDINYEIE